MKRQNGFTLVELMVTVVIIGILLATAIPVYKTWQQRAYGKEAALMAKRIIEGQIIYFLEHDKFFPEDTPMFIPDTVNPTKTQQNIQDLEDALNISIPTGHFLDYQLDNQTTQFQVRIEAAFPLFKGGFTRLIATVNTNGEIIIFPG